MIAWLYKYVFRGIGWVFLAAIVTALALMAIQIAERYHGSLRSILESATR